PSSTRRQLISAMNWMGGLALLLFWLPVAGPLIAGLVGGWKAGSVGRAFAAVFLPAVLLFIMTFAGVTYLTDAFWGFLAGAGAAVISLFNLGPLLLGALGGGLAAELREWRRPAAVNLPPSEDVEKLTDDGTEKRSNVDIV
ncbi:MAG TPA: hypothetical protein VL132_19630, partial [Planctomycetaceae bacterium]|nr:hypothetical protein [Planctomycetaceae bacterium]